MSEQQFKYSETFVSFQGEGFYTGRATNWIRLFSCNLQCAGFGQDNPTDPSTYLEPYKTFDVDSIKRVEDLPVWEYGCDSSYTWSARFKHLMHDKTAAAICDELEERLSNDRNPSGLFLHPATKQWTHMAFTGGEPMLKANQKAIIAILQEFEERDNLPMYCTVETNGTQAPTADFKRLMYDYKDVYQGFEWFWSVSPKLWTTAGEKHDKAIKPDVVGMYANINNRGQLKYVVNGTDESWKEVEENTKMFREEGVEWDVYIMPVGATKQEQEEPQIAEIAVEAMARGYHVAPRVHCYVFGNQIGT